MDKEDIQKMNSMKWYHKVDLGNGVVTPGHNFDLLWNPLKEQMQKVDFSGKAVLDIGCWDGLWSFEAEKLGAADVWATDIVSQRSFSDQKWETLEFAKTQLKSNIRYREASIYDIDHFFGEEFDIVIFFGVLYHLRYPQLGVARLRNVMKPDALLLLETAVLLDTDDTLIQTSYSKIYPHDRSTWNAFSKASLTALLEESYFSLEDYQVILRQDEERKIGRAFVKARAYHGKCQHHFFPDAFLSKHFVPLV